MSQRKGREGWMCSIYLRVRVRHHEQRHRILFLKVCFSAWFLYHSMLWCTLKFYSYRLSSCEVKFHFCNNISKVSDRRFISQFLCNISSLCVLFSWLSPVLLSLYFPQYPPETCTSHRPQMLLGCFTTVFYLPGCLFSFILWSYEKT